MDANGNGILSWEEFRDAITQVANTMEDSQMNVDTEEEQSAEINGNFFHEEKQEENEQEGEREYSDNNEDCAEDDYEENAEYNDDKMSQNEFVEGQKNHEFDKKTPDANDGCEQNTKHLNLDLNDSDLANHVTAEDRVKYSAGDVHTLEEMSDLDFSYQNSEAAKSPAEQVSLIL